MFHSYFESKNDKVLKVNIVHFPKLNEIIPSNYCRPLISTALQFQNLISARGT